MNSVPPRGEFHTDAAHRAVYSRAACIYTRRPRGVLYAKADEDLEWALTYASENRMPLTLRGGGSGLAGQTVGDGLVADVSRWMTGVRDFSPERREVRVQPGVVLSTLNRVLAPAGLKFAPDPSSQDFCTLGGMLANNSKGARSVKYGTTSAHVKALTMLLADGAKVTLERGERVPGSYGHPALRRAAALIDENRDRIVRQWPKSRTNASGYNLKDCVGPGGGVDLLPLFIGSEGTLAVFLEAKLDLTPMPRHQAMILLMFPDVESAGRAVLDIRPLGPSACEILDDTFLQIIRSGLGRFPLPVDDAAHTLLIVETDGDSKDEAEAAMDAVQKAAAAYGPVGVRRAATADERSAIWSFRKAASPLLNKGRGALKSTRFIEDGAVPGEAIPDYLRGVARILEARKIDTVIFGHAGDGNFHVNPFIDLKDPKHFRQVPIIAREVAELIGSLKGALSGEHGDGRLRTPYLPLIYGDLTKLFRDIKLALDPDEVLNPGIIAPAEPEPIDKGLRFHPGYRRVALPGHLQEASWAFEAERCHGCGTCRDFCPTAQASHHDLLASRGRGHLLQALLAGELDPSEAARPEIREIFESCLGCSQCAIHCPTAVDIAPLAAAFREAFTPKLARARDAFLGRVPSLGYRTGPDVGRLLGKAGNTAPARLVNRALLGLRPDMTAPEMAPDFAFDPSRLYRYEGTGNGRALYFYGCYGNIYNPGGEALLAVSVMKALGVEVVIPPQACCGVSKMTRGLLDMTAPDVAFNRKTFLPYVRDGFKVIASAPSCLLALRREQPRFFPGEEGESLASACTPLFSFLKEVLDGAKPDLRPVPVRVVYQTPCHSAVLGSFQDEVDVLRTIPGVEVLDVTEECCGLSGSFGAEARHAGLSDAIARPLMERIAKSRPDAVVTPCGSCKTQDETHLPWPVYHPLTLLARTLGLDAPDIAGAPCPSAGTQKQRNDDGFRH